VPSNRTLSLNPIDWQEYPQRWFAVPVPPPLPHLTPQTTGPPINQQTNLFSQNSKSLRRLASDHASLHTAGLPPNYLFPPNNSSSDPSADLTTLDVLLAGPPGTPFAAGLFALHLSIPPTYPVAPPTATFRTRIFHPNVDEATGAVCVETLKRDWSEKLRLRDVLVTISCLLIQPNPESALNAEAGRLCAEDWGGFERRVKVWVGIHAGVPKGLVKAVEEARARGEEKKKGEGQLEDSTAQKGGEVNAVAKGKGKGKEKEVLATPKAKRKAIVRDVGTEEEENRARREATLDQESDPESDWIPGPVKAAEPFGPGRDNIFGIRIGCGDAMDVDHAMSSVDAGPSATETAQNKDVFTNESIVRTPSLQIIGPSPADITMTPQQTQQASKTPLTFAHSNPFAPIQSSAHTRPNSLIAEFSLSWADSQTLHETGSITDAPSKVEVLKRLRDPEEVQKASWERKRFKAAGGNLAAYNRGNWGARVGLHRL
jgi:ubiquitin-conjugating enzyme E2 S